MAVHLNKHKLDKLTEMTQKYKKNDMSNLTINRIVSDIVSEIKRSGKSIESISEESIFNFLEYNGVDKRMYSIIYDLICQNFKNSKQSTSIGKTGTISKETFVKTEYPSEITKTEHKLREPRKSVFSEIIKL